MSLCGQTKRATQHRRVSIPGGRLANFKSNIKTFNQVQDSLKFMRDHVNGNISN